MRDMILAYSHITTYECVCTPRRSNICACLYTTRHVTYIFSIHESCRYTWVMSLIYDIHEACPVTHETCHLHILILQHGSCTLFECSAYIYIYVYTYIYIHTYTYIIVFSCSWQHKHILYSHILTNMHILIFLQHVYFHITTCIFSYYHMHILTFLQHAYSHITTCIFW